MLKEKSNTKKEKEKNRCSFGNEISYFYTYVLRKGYCGNNKRKIERKDTTITRQYVTIKNQVLKDKISKCYMQSLQKRVV